MIWLQFRGHDNKTINSVLNGTALNWYLHWFVSAEILMSSWTNKAATGIYDSWIHTNILQQWPSNDTKAAGIRQIRLVLLNCVFTLWALSYTHMWRKLKAWGGKVLIYLKSVQIHICCLVPGEAWLSCSAVTADKANWFKVLTHLTKFNNSCGNSKLNCGCVWRK